MATLFKTRDQAEKEAKLWRERGFDVKILKTEKPGFKYKIMSTGKREHIRLNMNQKEIAEGRRAGIPEHIIGRMIQGLELSELDKSVVKSHGKVYVEAHKKNGKWIKPQLRDLPGGRRSLYSDPFIGYASWEEDLGFRIADIGAVDQEKEDELYALRNKLSELARKPFKENRLRTDKEKKEGRKLKEELESKIERYEKELGL